MTRRRGEEAAPFAPGEQRGQAMPASDCKGRVWISDEAAMVHCDGNWYRCCGMIAMAKAERKALEEKLWSWLALVSKCRA